MDSLVQLPGVGRKTANVVLGVAFGKSTGVVVDTHVGRLSRRLGLTAHDDPKKVEQDLMGLVPQNEWINIAHRLIEHGRRICTARRPNCEACVLNDLCPKIGVQPVAMKTNHEGAKTRRKSTKES
jgi:endonuclease-3